MVDIVFHLSVSMLQFLEGICRRYFSCIFTSMLKEIAWIRVLSPLDKSIVSMSVTCLEIMHFRQTSKGTSFLGEKGEKHVPIELFQVKIIMNCYFGLRWSSTVVPRCPDSHCLHSPESTVISTQIQTLAFTQTMAIWTPWNNRGGPP